MFNNGASHEKHSAMTLRRLVQSLWLKPSSFTRNTEATILTTMSNSSTRMATTRRVKERYPTGMPGCTLNLSVSMKVVLLSLFFCLLLNGLIALQNGERLKAPEITAIAKKTWQKMSYDEQKAVTTPAIQELQDIREMKTLSKRNVALSAFHDTKKTLESLENQVSPILVILFFYLMLF